MKSKYSVREKMHILESYESSGKSVVAFAQENNINKSTLASWIKATSRSAEGQSSKTVGFVEIKALQVKGRQQSITIRKSGVEVEFPLSADSNHLKNILQVLVAL